MIQLNMNMIHYIQLIVLHKQKFLMEKFINKILVTLTHGWGYLPVILMSIWYIYQAMMKFSEDGLPKTAVILVIHHPWLPSNEVMIIFVFCQG